jgi:hypothetical protein
MTGAMGAAGKDAPATKIPHLFMADDGTDLGPLTAENTAFDEQLGVEINYVTALVIDYDAPNCTGNVHVQNNNGPRRSLRYISQHSTLIEITSTRETYTALSQEVPTANGGGVCSPADAIGVMGFKSIETPTTTKPMIASDLSIALR